MIFARKYFIQLTTFFVFIIYLITLAPTVVEIDSGELAAVQSTWGIAHPTGYPLFTIIGNMFSHIPLPVSKIFQLNLLAAIWCSLAVGMFIYTVKLIFDNVESFSPVKVKIVNKKNKKTKELSNIPAITLPDNKKILISVISGLVLALNKTFWNQSTSVEVYSIHAFLILLSILLLVKGFLVKPEQEKSFFRSPWFYFTISLALSFTNHMTTIFILPATAYLFFSKYKFRKDSFIKILKMLAVFIPILLIIYAYLPLTAAQNPNMNWGNPVNLENILRHISGKQYQVWLFSSTDSAKKQLLYFVSNLPKEYTVGLIFILIGFFSTLKTSRKLFLFFLLLFITTVFYSINYDIDDIDSYFLLTYIALSFFAASGIKVLLTELKTKKNSYQIALTIIAVVLCTHFYITYNEVNRNDNYIFQDYTKNLVQSTGKNSIILSYQWDYFISASYYFQLVEKFRPDVTIIDKELLRRSWYYHQISTVHPEIFDLMPNEVTNFINAVKPFEKDERYNAVLLENSYRDVMQKLISTNIDNKNFYIGPELFENEMQKGEFTLPEGYTLIPSLFLFKIVKGSSYFPAPDPDFILRLPKSRNRYVLMIETFVGSMLTRRALYELQFNKTERARLYIQKIRSDLPDYIIPQDILNTISN